MVEIYSVQYSLTLFSFLLIFKIISHLLYFFNLSQIKKNDLFLIPAFAVQHTGCPLKNQTVEFTYC